MVISDYLSIISVGLISNSKSQPELKISLIQYIIHVRPTFLSFRKLFLLLDIVYLEPLCPSVGGRTHAPPPTRIHHCTVDDATPPTTTPTLK